MSYPELGGGPDNLPFSVERIGTVNYRKFALQIKFLIKNYYQRDPLTDHQATSLRLMGQACRLVSGFQGK